MVETALIIIHIYIFYRIAIYLVARSEAKRAHVLPGHVELMDTELEAVPNGSLEVQYLNIAYNMLETLPNYVFLNNSYKNAKKINLNENCIHTIHVHAFKGLRQLKTVELSSNNLTHLDPYTFKSNHKMERLVLHDNCLSFHRTQTFLVSHSIETLVLSKNSITDVYDTTFLGLPSLRELILSDNELSFISSHSFKQLSHLRYLSLANTKVHRLSDSCFGVVPRILNLEDSPLGDTFDPPLKEVIGDAVKTLLDLNRKFGS